MPNAVQKNEHGANKVGTFAKLAIPPLFSQAIVSLSLLSISCGGNTNLLRAIAPNDQILSYENYADSARAAYNQGQYEKAWILGTKAYQLNPGGESISILLGYIGLSLAGGDPFRLAKAMVEANKSEQKKEQFAFIETSSTGDILTEELTLKSDNLLNSGSPSSTLTSFQKAIDLTNDELEQLGEKDLTDPELPLLKPKCVELLRRDIPRLVYLDQTIRLVCPFVDPSARIKTDYRQNCQPFDGTRTEENKAHFLWAFAHLTEALAFNTVLTYTTVDSVGSKSNLELRAEKVRRLQTNDPESLDRFLGAVKGLESAVDAVLPRTNSCSDVAPTSQLRATLHNLLAVNAGLAKLSSIPKNIVSSINAATEKLNSSTDSFQTIRSDFTKKTAENLADKIEELGKNPEQPLTPDQKSSLCGTLSSLGSTRWPEACRLDSN